MSTKKERDTFHEKAAAWAEEHGLAYEHGPVNAVLYVPEDRRAWGLPMPPGMPMLPTIRAYKDLRDVTDFDKGWRITVVTETEIRGLASLDDVQAMFDLMNRW